MIRNERLCAQMDGPFVVFLIGMRINKPWKVHKWWPVASAMPRMLSELARRPESGMLAGQMWSGRTTILVQYWRTIDQLMAYAKDKESEHLPAWRDFNRAIGTSGDVGVWHETYFVEPGAYESIYVNMPPFGLGRAGALLPATQGRQTAEERLRAQQPRP